MPAAFAAPAIGGTVAAIAGTAAAGASLYGADKQAGASRDASRAAERSAAEALALERENEARRRQEWDQTQAFNEQAYKEALARDDARYADTRADTAFSRERANRLDAFDREQYDRREVRRGPYRDVSKAALYATAEKAGLKVTPASMSRLVGQ